MDHNLLVTIIKYIGAFIIGATTSILGAPMWILIFAVIIWVVGADYLFKKEQEQQSGESSQNETE